MFSLMTETEFVGALRSLKASVQNVSLDENLLEIAPHHIGFNLANFSSLQQVLYIRNAFSFLFIHEVILGKVMFSI